MDTECAKVSLFADNPIYMENPRDKKLVRYLRKVERYVA